jgi:hypothetical protein
MACSSQISINDFSGSLVRVLERLQTEGEAVGERDWVMMGAINFGAVLEYSRAAGISRRAGGFGQRDGPNFGGSGVMVVGKRTIIAEDEEKI